MEVYNRDNVGDVNLGNVLGACLGHWSYDLPMMDESSREHALND
jgi:hypothetical protein